MVRSGRPRRGWRNASSSRASSLRSPWPGGRPEWPCAVESGVDARGQEPARGRSGVGWSKTSVAGSFRPVAAASWLRSSSAVSESNPAPGTPRPGSIVVPPGDRARRGLVADHAEQRRFGLGRGQRRTSRSREAAPSADSPADPAARAAAAPVRAAQQRRGRARRRRSSRAGTSTGSSRETARVEQGEALARTPSAARPPRRRAASVRRRGRRPSRCARPRSPRPARRAGRPSAAAVLGEARRGRRWPPRSWPARRCRARPRRGEQHERGQVQVAGQLVQVPGARRTFGAQHRVQALRGQRVDHAVVEHAGACGSPRSAGARTGSRRAARRRRRGRRRRRPRSRPGRPSAASSSREFRRRPGRRRRAGCSAPGARTPWRVTRCRASSPPRPPVPPVISTVPGPTPDVLAGRSGTGPRARARARHEWPSPEHRELRFGGGRHRQAGPGSGAGRPSVHEHETVRVLGLRGAHQSPDRGGRGVGARTGRRGRRPASRRRGGSRRTGRRPSQARAQRSTVEAELGGAAASAPSAQLRSAPATDERRVSRRGGAERRGRRSVGARQGRGHRIGCSGPRTGAGGPRGPQAGPVHPEQGVLVAELSAGSCGRRRAAGAASATPHDGGSARSATVSATPCRRPRARSADTQERPAAAVSTRTPVQRERQPAPRRRASSTTAPRPAGMQRGVEQGRVQAVAAARAVVGGQFDLGEESSPGATRARRPRKRARSRSPARPAGRSRPSTCDLGSAPAGGQTARLSARTGACRCGPERRRSALRRPLAASPSARRECTLHRAPLAVDGAADLTRSRARAGQDQRGFQGEFVDRRRSPTCGPPAGPAPASAVAGTSTVPWTTWSASQGWRAMREPPGAAPGRRPVGQLDHRAEQRVVRPRQPVGRVGPVRRGGQPVALPLEGIRGQLDRRAVQGRERRLPVAPATPATYGLGAPTGRSAPGRPRRGAACPRRRPRRPRCPAVC